MLYEYNKLIQYAINLTHNDAIMSDFRRIADSCQEAGVEENIIGKTNRDETQNQMRLKFARKLQKRNVTEKSHTSYSQKWLSNVN